MGILPETSWGGCRNTVPALFERLEYWIVEPSAGRQAIQARRLIEFGDTVRWVASLGQLDGTTAVSPGADRAACLRGVIFSNELLDAMPVHRLGWDAKVKTWFEWGVALDQGRFVWTRLKDRGWGHGQEHSEAPFSIAALQLPSEPQLLEVLPDGFTTEICPAAAQWWHQAATILECGRLVTIDYGLPASELFAPETKPGHAAGISPASVDQ